MKYNIKKFDAITQQWENKGGGFTEAEVEQITNGFSFNGLFYTRETDETMFVVEPENEVGKYGQLFLK